MKLCREGESGILSHMSIVKGRKGMEKLSVYLGLHVPEDLKTVETAKAVGDLALFPGAEEGE